jgi:tetratricopeptide (TPR) repeat protein
MRHVPPSKKLVFSFTLLLASALVAPSVSRAADQKAALAKIKARYQAAAGAYDDGQFEKVEAQLQQALKLAEDNGLSENKVIAQAYVLYGVLEVAGLKNAAQGVKYFAKAIEISPAIQVPPTMASKAVVAAFERAENQESEPASAQAEAAEASEEQPKPSKSTGRADKAQGSARGDAESDKLVDDLATAKVNESLQQADKERLQKEKQEQDRSLPAPRATPRSWPRRRQSWPRRRQSRSGRSPTPRASFTISIATSRIATSSSPTSRRRSPS